MNTQELIKVLESHRDIIKVELETVKNASDFWESFCNVVFNALPATDLYNPQGECIGRVDKRILNTLVEFAQSDTLDLVNKQGRLLKRFAKFYKETHGEKLDDKTAGVIGDTLQNYVNKQTRAFYADFTDTIDWSDGQFGKSGSCWWGTYRDSVPAYQDAGGWGIRFYNDENQDYDNGCGRTWVFPKDGMLMCFNSYGVERPNVSKVIKSIFRQHNIELHYKVVELYNSNNDTIPYINSGTGFLLYPEEIDSESLDSRYDVDIDTSECENLYTCDSCGCEVNEDEVRSHDGDYYCDDCFNERYSYCDRCGEDYDSEDVHEVHGHRSYEYLCEDCISYMEFRECYHCEEYHLEGVEDNAGDFYCEDCASNHLYYCEECEEFDTDEHDHSEDEESEIDTESNDTESNDEPSDEYDFISQNLETVPYHDIRTGEIKYRTLQVYRHDHVPGLYICYDEKIHCGWNITHESSGFAAWMNIPSLFSAIQFLERVQDVDWTQSHQSITNNHELVEQILKIRHELS